MEEKVRMKLSALFLIAALVFCVHAAPGIGTVKVAPMTAVIGTPTQFTIQASITAPSLIPNSVNLLELNHDGTTTILGVLHDDGLNGDSFVGDLVFTLLVTLNAPTTSQLQLQVSAAFKGVLLRVKSPVFNVFFQPADAPQQAVKVIAQNLAAGNISAALDYVIPSNSALNALSQPALNVLASILNSAVLVDSETDLRIFNAPFTTPSGEIATVAFTMVPGPNGQWLINSW
jgi:hypothetical protein